MSRFVILFARYIAAIITACFISAVIFFTPTFMLVFIGVDSLIPYCLYALMPVMGFCGVYSGCFCLERTSRRFGSIALLVLGLAYYIHWMAFLGYREGKNEAHPYVWVVGLAALALGGLVAVICVFRQSSPNKSPEPTAVGAGSSAVAGHATSRRWLSFFR